MATLGNIESRGAAEQLAGSVDLLIGVAGPVDGEELRSLAMQAIGGIGSPNDLPSRELRIAIASPITSGLEKEAAAVDTEGGVNYLGYPLSPNSTPVLPWLASPAAYRAIAQLAETLQVRSCVMISQDLAGLKGNTIEALSRPLLSGSTTLTMPVYPSGKYEGLLNSAVVYPFTRALYGKQIRYPLAVEFGIAGGMISRLALEHGRGPAQSIICPALEGALGIASIAEAYVDVQHATHSEGIDLSTVLGGLATGLFEDAEKNAPYWQRIRGSQPTPVFGTPYSTIEDGEGVDVRPLIESFQLGLRNLQQVWGLVLPPVTLLELRKMSRVAAADFRMPDALWARIIYDFALAHRLRTISRTHLLGALTPLYLGWVASYAMEVAKQDGPAARERVERLALAFEENKSYFVSRWRWPDRFNP